ncbi:divalent-cation tolerance protein CutA [Uliginosibacterium sp. H3]|uniref:Divalent-cation tolerance protein CutA n=1 Tax=Uliginosibacterium silvisoli TaxID=3114758 RepID=A0ABU6JZ97_9RHOO|nr:divalent-cation tolerance protein CutA [Uliginosibacterium sp. H3]
MLPNSVLMVLTTVPDADTAQKIARSLVERRLAACVNILAPCQSIYNWQGSVEDSNEIPMLIKTTAARYGMLEAAITALHPHEVPEIVALPLSHGLPEYLGWVVAETQPD